MKIGPMTAKDIVIFCMWATRDSDWDRVIKDLVMLGFSHDALYLSVLRVYYAVHHDAEARGVFPMPLSPNDLAAMRQNPISHDDMLALMRRRGVPEELIASYDQANIDSIEAARDG